MIDDRDLFERASLLFDPPATALDRLLRRRDRRRRNERIVAATLALVLAAAAIGGAIRVFRSAQKTVPANPTIDGSNVSDLQLLATGSMSNSNLHGVFVSGGVVYVEGTDRTLAAFPASCGSQGGTCRPLWQASLEGKHQALQLTGPWVSDGIAYVSTDALYSYGPPCGPDRGQGVMCDPRWVAHVDGTPSRPVVANGLVYVTSNTNQHVSRSNQLYAFPTSCAPNGGECEPMWVARLPSGPDHEPVVVGDRLYVTDYASGRYEVFPTSCSRPTCRPLGSWRVDRPADNYSFPAFGADAIFVTTIESASSGTLIGYPASCGVSPGCRPLWTASVPGGIASPPPLVVGDRVFVGSYFDGDFVEAFAAGGCGATTCQPLWSASVPGLSWSPFRVSNDVLYAPSQTGGIYSFRTDCGTGNATCEPAWTWGTGSNGPVVRINSVFATADRIYASGSKGKLYVFGLRPGSRPASTSTRRAAALFYGALLALAILAVLVTSRRKRMKLD